ncbi:MAG: hypothetical protein N2513_10515 [Deltaproteobacteria bacterium]|nr:hypothetical protein [Deltaproteobacteria bacterium]
MNLNDMAKEVHQNAVEHGWWEKDIHFGSLVALMHSELSEALEEFRNHKPNVYYKCGYCTEGGCYFDDINKPPCGEEAEKAYIKPEGIAIELADCIIRILDYCGKENIDIEEAIRIKHEYNKTRPYRHGGKQI